MCDRNSQNLQTPKQTARTSNRRRQSFLVQTARLLRTLPCFFSPQQVRLAMHTAPIAFAGLSSLEIRTSNLHKAMQKVSSTISRFTQRSVIFSSLVVIQWSWRPNSFGGIWNLSRIRSFFHTSKTCALEQGLWHFGLKGFSPMMMPTRCWSWCARYAKLASAMSPSWLIWVARRNVDTKLTSQ